MKKMKIILEVGLLGLLLSGCTIGGGETNPPDPTHEHTYSGEWSHDETYHWHAATCEHTSEVKDKEAHTFGEWVIDAEATENETGSKHRICNKCEYRVDEIINKVEHTHIAGTPVEENRHEATCTEDGSYDLVTYCTVDGVELSREHKTINALGHDWSEITYSWSSDNSSCTAVAECSRNNSHILTETKQSTYLVVNEPDCENVGLCRYVVEFENNLFTTQTQYVTLDACGHDWNLPIYTWSDDYSSCTAKRICKKNSNHVETETRESTYVELTTPTEENNGSARFSVSFSNPAFQTQIKDISLPATGTLDKLNFTLNSDENSYSVKGLSYPATVEGKIVIPDYYNNLPVTEISENAFDIGFNSSFQNITSFVIGSNIRIIGEEAFSGCKTITSIAFPNSVESIGDYAFSGCYKLAYIDLNEGLLQLGSFCFFNCIKLRKIYIPDTVVEVGGGLFSGCDILTEISLPFLGKNRNTSEETTNSTILHYFSSTTFLDNVDSTKYYTLGFYKNSGYFGWNNQQIFYYKFPRTLETIKIRTLINNKIFYHSFRGLSLVTKIELPNSFEEIGNYAFTNTGITNIVLPKSLKSIGKSAFGSCASLTSFSYSGTIEEWNSIIKGSTWNFGIGATVVHCTDGDVAI